MKKCIAAVLLLSLMLPVWAIAEDAGSYGYELVPVPIHVTLGRAAFSREAGRYNEALAALGDTQNTAVFPVGLADEGQEFTPEFYDALQYLTLSPDGGRLFAVLDGLPFIHDLAGGLTFVAPDPAMGQEYYELYRRLIIRPEDGSAAWSPDGRWLALAWPRMVLTQMRLGANVLLIDTRAGTAAPVVKDLPADASLFKPAKDSGAGYPIRAAFTPDGETLYIEMFGAEDEALGRHNALLAHDLRTGESRTVSLFPWEDLTAEGGLYPAAGGLFATVGSMAGGITRFGLVKRGIGAPDVYSYAKEDEELRLRVSLLDAAGDAALLRLEPLDARTQAGALRFLNHLGGLTGTLPGTALAIARDGDSRPVARRLPLSEVYNETGTAYREGLLDAYSIPVNGALAPDGQRLLALTRGAQGETALYLEDLRTGALSEVDLSALGIVPEDQFGMYMSFGSNMARGLRLFGGDMVLAVVRGHYRVYELRKTGD